MSLLNSMKDAFKTLYTDFNIGLTRQVEGPVQSIEEWRYSSTPSDDVGPNGEFLFRDTTLEEAQMHLTFDPGMKGVSEFADAHTKIVPYEIEDNDGNYTLFNSTTDDRPRIPFGRAKELFGGLEPWYKIKDELEYPSVAPVDEYEDITADVELLDQFNVAISDLVLGFEDSPHYHMEALKIAGSPDMIDLDGAKDTLVSLRNLNGDYQAEKQVAMEEYNREKEKARLEKNASMLSYKDVLFRADELAQKVSDYVSAGIVMNGLHAKITYKNPLDKVYMGLDRAMDFGSDEKQEILAKQKQKLIDLEAKLERGVISKAESIGRKTETAYARAISVGEEPQEVTEQLYCGAKDMATLVADIKSNGLGGRDTQLYAGIMKDVDALAEDVLTIEVDGKQVSTYIPLPFKVAQPQL